MFCFLFYSFSNFEECAVTPLYIDGLQMDVLPYYSVFCAPQWSDTTYLLFITDTYPVHRAPCIRSDLAGVARVNCSPATGRLMNGLIVQGSATVGLARPSVPRTMWDSNSLWERNTHISDLKILALTLGTFEDQRLIEHAISSYNLVAAQHPNDFNVLTLTLLHLLPVLMAWKNCNGQYIW